MLTILSCSILIICVIILTRTSEAQNKFNHFKSYKDSKVKPPHYGMKVKNSHPIHEYLNEDQKRMMKHRKSDVHHPDAVYKETWSGFDKSTRRLRIESVIDENTEKPRVMSSSDYLKSICLLLVVGSVAWICYMLIHRQNSARKSVSSVKSSSGAVIEAVNV